MTTARAARRTLAGLLALATGLTIAAAAPRQASAASAASYKYTYSKIAWTGSRTVIAAADSHGDLYYFWQASGASAWHKVLVAKGGHGNSYSKPAIAWTGSAVGIVALDSSKSLVYFSEHSGSSTWHHQRVVTASRTFGAPSIAATPGGTVLVSAGNAAGTLDTYQRAPGATSWTSETASFGTFTAASIATCYDSLVGQYLGLLTATSGGTLYFWWELVTAPGWSRETIDTPGAAGSFSGAAVTATTSDVLVASVTASGSVTEWSQAIGGTGWGVQAVVPGGSTVYSHPVIAWTGPVDGGSDSFQVIAATTQSGRLAYWWAEDGTPPWTAETVAAAGKNMVFAYPGITVTSTSVTLTAVNTKPGNVVSWFQPFLTNPWHKQVVAKG